MSGTLAEAKAQLGYVSSQLAKHAPGWEGCDDCTIATGPKGKPKRLCAQGLALKAEKLELTEQIRTWFAPPQDQPSFFEDM